MAEVQRASQKLVLVEVQERVEVLPEVMVLGLAERVTEGSVEPPPPDVTVTVVVAVVVPKFPPQRIEYVVVVAGETT